MQELYRTLFKEGMEEFVERKSRFLGYAAPVKTEEEALAFLNKIRAMHREASHHCYAYILGRNGERARFSDDGEPSGTAGMPILEVLKGRQLCDCICVVVRYFGGVLLGTGGLVRAYTQGARVGVAQAGISQMFLTEHVLFSSGYSFYAAIDRFLQKGTYQINEISFEADITYDLYLKKKDLAALQTFLTTLSAGKIEVLVLEELYHPWVDDTEN